MTKILSLSALGAALLSLAACAGYPGTAINTGGSGATTTAIGIGDGAPGLVSRCPEDATTPSGQQWHPGAYCLPGGRKS